MKIADDRDFTFLNKMNLVGEKITNAILQDLESPHRTSYLAGEIVIRAYDKSRGSHSKKRVHFKSSYASKLQLLYVLGFPHDMSRFLYAVARIRNAYAHELDHVEKRILNVVASRFTSDESRDIIDAITYELDDVLGGFFFEGAKPERGNCGSYIDFQGNLVERRISYSAEELIKLGKRGVHREIKTSITWGARSIAAVVQMVAESEQETSELDI